MLPLFRRRSSQHHGATSPSITTSTKHNRTNRGDTVGSRETRVLMSLVLLLGVTLIGGIQAVVFALLVFAFAVLLSKQRHGLDSSLQRKRRYLLILLSVFLCIFSLYGFHKLAQALGYKPPFLSWGFEPASSTLTVFLIDGLRADIFEEEMAAGRLPNLLQLATEGCRVKNVAATFPTVTGYAYWPLLTGIDATRSNHLGTRYFDRHIDKGNWHNYHGPANQMFNPDLQEKTPTLFESATHGWSLSTNSLVTRGASVKYNTRTEQAFSKALHTWWLPRLIRKLPFVGSTIAPTFAESEVHYMRRIVKMVTRKQPSLAWIVFSGAENCAHTFGVNEQYRETVRAIDNAIGSYIQAVQARNQKHTFAVISDHGVASVDAQAGGNLDLCLAFTPLRAWCGDSMDWSGKLDEPLATFGADKDVLVGINGDMSAAVYVKNPSGAWKLRTYEAGLLHYKTEALESEINVIQSALDYGGVQLVAWSRQNGVVALQTTTLEKGDDSAVGVIEFDESDGGISYHVERTESKQRCPFGYDSQLADGTKRYARQWLDATADSPYPYAVVRLVQYFTVPDLAPDMVVVAHDDFDFGKPWDYYRGNFAGGDGGIHRDHIRVPAIFSGPGVTPSSKVETATVEDVGASLHLLLKSPHSKRSLDFLDSHRHDAIARAFRNNKEKKEGENHAQDLLRGSPLSCLSS